MKKTYPLIIGTVLLLLTGLALAQGQDEAVMSIPDEFPNRPFLFFKEISDSYNGEIYLAYQDGQAPALLTEESVGYDFMWSPDGRWLVYEHFEPYGGGYTSLGIYILDFITGEELLLDDIFNINALGLGLESWSMRWLDDGLLSIATQDNRTYYFFDMASQTYTAWEMPLEYELARHGNSLSFITDSQWLYTNLYQSPDNSEQIAMEIVIWDNENQTQTRLLEAGPYSTDFAMLSPNRLQIAYTYVEEKSPRIAVMNIDGSNQEIIFELDAEEALEMLEEGHVGGNVTQLLDSLNWSPDSTALSFLLNRALYTIDADGTNLEEIESMPYVNHVSWLSNDLLYVLMPAYSELPTFSFVQTDGNVIEPVEFAGEPVSWIEILSPNADENALARIETIMNTGIIANPTPIRVTPNLSPTPFPVFCEDAPPSRVGLGDLAFVTISEEGQTREDLRVRDEPNGERIGSMAEGSQFRIIGGPVCADGLTWWEIETLDGSLRGWSAEGVAPDDYFIAPES